MTYLISWCCDCLSVSKLFLTVCDLWTVAHQAPLSMGFPGKNTGVGCQFLLQGIFSNQGSNPCLLHWQVDSLPLSHQGSYLIRDVNSIEAVVRAYLDILCSCRRNTWIDSLLPNCCYSSECISKVSHYYFRT